MPILAALFFGAAPTLTDAVPLAQALAAPEAYADREIAVEGTVRKVCQKKGCWLTLEDGEAKVRVTFKDYGFFVPKDLPGRRARVQGVVFRETLSKRTVRHFLKDEGASKEEIKKVDGPVETVSFVASGLQVLD